MREVTQELMTPQEAARWFRRSVSWLRQQRQLLKLRSRCGQPLFHVQVCRAYVLGKLCGLSGPQLRRVQLEALAAACGLQELSSLIDDSDDKPPGERAHAAAV